MAFASNVTFRLPSHSLESESVINAAVTCIQATLPKKRNCANVVKSTMISYKLAKKRVSRLSSLGLDMLHLKADPALEGNAT
jgi:hypothetical protein